MLTYDKFIKHQLVNELVWDEFLQACKSFFSRMQKGLEQRTSVDWLCRRLWLLLLRSDVDAMISRRPSFVRQSHCWRCGEVFCTRCLDKQTPLPGHLNQRPAPVCRSCYKATRLSSTSVTSPWRKNKIKASDAVGPDPDSPLPFWRYPAGNCS